MKLCALLVVLVFVFPSRATASSVLQVTFQDLVLSSELAFEGRVVSKRAEADNRGMIHTYVTFEIMDILKGTHAASTITLRYLGGTAGEFSLNIADLVSPAVGEKGIYFVESVNRLLAHPLYGWDQGRFIVAAGEAGPLEHVFSGSMKPVIGFQLQQGKATGLSQGVASGLLVAEPDQSKQAITVSDFKQRVREVIAGR